MPRLCSSLLLSLLMASGASAVAMHWTFIGDPGNAADDTGYGAVGYDYLIGTYEVTNAQYAEFLNAKAASASDPLELYHFSMAGTYGGITRSCSPSCTYSVIAGRADMPVSYVTFFDAARFANWMNNGQGSGDTETGAYTLLGGTATPSNGTTVTRNPGATIFLTSEDEWYKAAYYRASSASYFDYPAGSDTQTTCTTPSATANSANCNTWVGNLSIKGSYTGSASPYGTFDQGGNVWEWNEAIIDESRRGVRGGSFESGGGGLAASYRLDINPSFVYRELGFRVAPEPGSDLLLVAGVLSVLGLAGLRRGRA